MIYQLVFELLIYIFEALIFFYYTKSFFELKRRFIPTVFICIAGYVVAFGIYKLGFSSLNAMSLLLINITLLSLLFECNFKEALFHSFTLIILMATTEWIFISFISMALNQDFNSYQSNSNVLILNMIASKFLYGCLCIFISRFFAKRKSNSHRDSLFWTLFLMPFTSIMVIFVFYYISATTNVSDFLKIIYSTISILLIFSNIIVFFIYEYSLNNAEELFRLRTEKQKAEIDKMYMELLEKKNNDLQVLTHDIKNHLSHIRSLMTNDEADEYISNLYGTINKYEYTGISKNKTLDIIINKYASICETKSIDITFDTKTANLSFVNSSDLSSIMNNLLDNAVEAAEKSVAKKIAIEIFSKSKAFEVLKITNSCDTSPRTFKSKLLTTKLDKEIHGFGTESVKKTLSKYDGVFEWEYDNQSKTFETLVIFSTKGTI